MYLVSAILPLLVLLLGYPYSPVLADTLIQSCGGLYSSGSYFLSSDIIVNSTLDENECIQFSGDNITFDGRGFAFIYPDGQTAVAISTNDATSVTIQNVVVVGDSAATACIYFNNVTSLQFLNNTITDCGYGLNIDRKGVKQVIIANSTFQNTQYGILAPFASGDSMNVENNFINSSIECVTVGPYGSVTIANNVLNAYGEYENYGTGINLFGGNGAVGNTEIRGNNMTVTQVGIAGNKVEGNVEVDGNRVQLMMSGGTGMYFNNTIVIAHGNTFLNCAKAVTYGVAPVSNSGPPFYNIGEGGLVFYSNIVANATSDYCISFGSSSVNQNGGYITITDNIFQNIVGPSGPTGPTPTGYACFNIINADSVAIYENDIQNVSLALIYAVVLPDPTNSIQIYDNIMEDLSSADDSIIEIIANQGVYMLYENNSIRRVTKTTCSSPWYLVDIVVQYGDYDSNTISDISVAASCSSPVIAYAVNIVHDYNLNIRDSYISNFTTSSTMVELGGFNTRINNANISSSVSYKNVNVSNLVTNGASTKAISALTNSGITITDVNIAGVRAGGAATGIYIGSANTTNIQSSQISGITSTATGNENVCSYANATGINDDSSTPNILVMCNNKITGVTVATSACNGTANNVLAKSLKISDQCTLDPGNFCNDFEDYSCYVVTCQIYSTFCSGLPASTYHIYTSTSTASSSSTSTSSFATSQFSTSISTSVHPSTSGHPTTSFNYSSSSTSSTSHISSTTSSSHSSTTSTPFSTASHVQVTTTTTTTTIIFCFVTLLLLLVSLL